MARFVFKSNKEDYLSRTFSSHQRWHTMFLSVIKKIICLERSQMPSLIPMHVDHRHVMSPEHGDRHVMSPEHGDRHVMSPEHGDRHVMSPEHGDRHVMSPKHGDRHVMSPEHGDRHVKFR